MNRLVFCAIALAVLISSASAAPVFRLALTEAEQKARAHSPRVQAIEAEAEAARLAAKSQFTTLWPKVSFDASYRYVTEIPQFAPSPNVPPQDFGDNESYSYGPVVSWLAWDTGNVYHRWKAAQAQWVAKQSASDVAIRQLMLDVRLAYFQVQLQLEQARLLTESLKLAQAQYRDIDVGRRAGTVSRLDALSAHQEVLNRRRDLRQAQSHLASGLRSLFAITGSSAAAEPSVSWEEDLVLNRPPDTEAPTLVVNFDPLEQSAVYLSSAATRPFDKTHPRLVQLASQIEALQMSVKSAQSGYGPSVLLNAKTSRDYPNGPVRESIHQNTFGVSASWPLFEFGKTPDLVEEQRSAMRAIEKQREQTQEDLERDWYRAHDQLLGLRAQRTINHQATEETRILQKLTYESYQAGRVNYLDVQTADLRVLQTRVETARNDVEILIQLAVLDSLSVKE